MAQPYKINKFLPDLFCIRIDKFMIRGTVILPLACAQTDEMNK